jgi:hypothetical protein
VRLSAFALLGFRRFLVICHRTLDRSCVIANEPGTRPCETTSIAIHCLSSVVARRTSDRLARLRKASSIYIFCQRFFNFSILCCLHYVLVLIRSSNMSLAQALVCTNKTRPWSGSVAYISLAPFGQCISVWCVAFARTLIVTSVLNIWVNTCFIFFYSLIM